MRRKFFRIIGWFVLFVVLVAGGFFAWLYFTEASNRSSFTVIPQDAIFVLHTENMSRGWHQVSGTAFWEALVETEKYRMITNTANEIDSLISENRTIQRLLERRPFTVSAHMAGPNHYDILLTIDLLRESRITILNDFIFQVMRLYGFDIQAIDHNQRQIIEVRPPDASYSFYIAFIDNIMAVSFNRNVMMSMVASTRETSLAALPGFQAAKERTSRFSLLSLYVNTSKLEDFISVYQDPSHYAPVFRSLEPIGFMSFDLDADHSRLSLSGHSLYESSVSPALQTIREGAAERPGAFGITPRETAVYLSFTFSDFQDFHQTLKREHQRNSPQSYNRYKSTLEQLDRLLNANVEELFTNWIGNEIAYIKLEPGQKTRITDAVIAVHSKDMEQAQASMESLARQVRRRLPARFESTDHHGYPIYFLNISGIFQLLLSDLLAGVDKPFFTYVDDYVVFSNNIEGLFHVIDARVREHTLHHDDAFMDFASDVNGRAPVSLYIQTPYAFRLMHAHSNPAVRGQLQENQEVFAAFSWLGFQFAPGDESLVSDLVIGHDPDALYRMTVAQMEAEATNLLSLDLQTRDFSVHIPEDSRGHSSFISLYHEDSVTVKARGELRRGEPHGEWRFYYPNGNMKALIPYHRGEADGKAFFYYNTPEQPLQCEAAFSSNQLHGDYKEYYKNGNLKAELSFRRNEENGDALFYYPDGNLKVEGRYRRGSKRGSWKHYTPSGEVYDRQYWRRSRS